jgi:hypothetical protein
MLNTAFDYDMIQALLIGNDFSYYENNIFKASIDNKQYKLSTLARTKLKNCIRNENDLDRLLIQDIWLDPETFKIVKETIKEIKKENNKLTVMYNVFEEYNGMLVPVDNVYEVKAENNILIHVKYSKVTIDEPKTLSFTIPDSYTLME